MAQWCECDQTDHRRSCVRNMNESMALQANQASINALSSSLAQAQAQQLYGLANTISPQPQHDAMVSPSFMQSPYLQVPLPLLADLEGQDAISSLGDME